MREHLHPENLKFRYLSVAENAKFTTLEFKRGIQTARAVNEPWCALGSHSIEVGDLEVEKDNNAKAVRVCFITF